MEAAVTPLPTEETTPPVQKMNLAISIYGESTKPRSVLSNQYIYRSRTLFRHPYTLFSQKSYHNSVPLSTRALDFTANQTCFIFSSSSSEGETSPYRTRM